MNGHDPLERLRSAVAVALGHEPADLVIRGGHIANVFTHEYEQMDIAIHQGKIVGVGLWYEGVESVDATGKILVPGLIDGHIHIESSLLTPAMFAAVVLARGTTTVMADAHEITNSCGLDGLSYMVRESIVLPLDILYSVPSCIPPSPFETCREEIDAEMIANTFRRSLGAYLGEMMNYHGIVDGNPNAWDRVNAAGYRVRTGHAPELGGEDLCAYLLSGCDSDHELDSAEEALEKLGRGMWLMLRYNDLSRDSGDLLGVLQENLSRFARCMVVSNNVSARGLHENGHIDHLIRLMIKKGVPPFVALAMGTLNPARYFRLWDRGAIAPGYNADIAMIDSLENFAVEKVWKRGKQVVSEGRFLSDLEPCLGRLPNATTNYAAPLPEQLAIPAKKGHRIRVIGLREDSNLTDELIMEPKIKDGVLVSDAARDMAYIFVLDKNQGSGRVGCGFVKGFTLRRGALASSVGHDAHNFIVVAADMPSALTAIRTLIENAGGLAVVNGDKVLAFQPLPVGGLMSLDSAQTVAANDHALAEAAQKLGCGLNRPFASLSFLSCSVIPELKITDYGYVNVTKNRLSSLFY